MQFYINKFKQFNAEIESLKAGLAIASDEVSIYHLLSQGYKVLEDIELVQKLIELEIKIGDLTKKPRRTKKMNTNKPEVIKAPSSIWRLARQTPKMGG